MSCATYTSCKLSFGGDDGDDSQAGGGSGGGGSISIDIERVSITSVGIQANGNSEAPSISSDGAIVAFISEATNLVPLDTNNAQDVFVHDRDTGITERVSVSSAGTQGDDDAFTLSLSSDGRIVAFGSFAANLVFGDTNDVIDVFVHDRDTGTTERVSIATTGAEADDESFSPAISSSGRFVAFRSDATNLVANDTNSKSDIFVRDRILGITRRVSVASDGTQADGDSTLPAISADGRFVVFSSGASNLVDEDTNNQADIFVHDRENDTTVRVVGPAEFSSGSGIVIVAPSISPDGGFVGLRSNADDLVLGDTNNSFDTFLIDRVAEIAERASISNSNTESNSDSSRPSIGSDNRFVVFSSGATNLVSEDTNGFEDVFVRDRIAGRTRRVSLTFDGLEADNRSFSAVVSGDGEFVAFASLAENLVANDTNGASDIFVTPNPLRP